MQKNNSLTPDESISLEYICDILYNARMIAEENMWDEFSPKVRELMHNLIETIDTQREIIWALVEGED